MRIHTALRRAGLAGLFLYAAAAGLWAAVQERPGDSPPAKSGLVLKTVILTVIACGILASGGALLFMASGFYNLAADTPHTFMVRWMLKTGRTRSVEFHSRGIRVPGFHTALAGSGLPLYRKECEPCHGAPGMANEQIGRGINPKPPRLVTSATHWSDAELYWIVSRGLKMSGMPAFAPRLSDRDRWAIVAFLREMILLSPADYGSLAADSDRGIQPVHWPSRKGFALLAKAKPERGRRLLGLYGCVGCHRIPGVGEGHVGPSLAGFAQRQYIAGTLVNEPGQLVLWIMDPAKYKRNTGMPDVGVQREDAIDIAAYLYTLGDQERNRAVERAIRLNRPEALAPKAPD
ncbi:MAG TPA: c-type cytochrome [Bryobacteraceae bacterium]|nr:c-type cytochrome [Bryobacteraceae bacterium]